MNIIFIPGLLCTQLIWGDLNDLRQEYQCYDADVCSYTSIKEMSAAIHASTTHSEDFAVIGVSMGGYVAIDLATKNIPSLKKLVLINTTAQPVDINTIKDREKAIALARDDKLDDIINLSNGYCYYNPKTEFIDLEKHMAKEIGAESYIKQQTAIINRSNYSDKLHQIKCQTLIIAGKQDKIVPLKDSLYLFENIPNANLITINECGHLATLEHSKVVNNFVKTFLSDM